MKQILDLREKRTKAWEGAKAFLDTKRSDDGTLSAEDAATYDKMEANVVSLGREIERLERLNALDLEMNQPTTRPMVSTPRSDEFEEKKGRGTESYKTAFWRAIRQKSVPHEVYNALQIGVESEGGYTVPDEYEHTLLEALQEVNIMRGIVHVITTSSGDRKIPLVTSKGSATWVEEEAVIPESDDAFGQITLSAHKVGSMIRISEELLRDSAFDLAAYISREFARRVGAAEEEAILTGDGAHKPTGLLHATLGAELGVTTAAAATIAADELMDLQHALKAGYRRNACYIMNDATVKLLRKLKDGNGQYLWQPGLLVGQPDTLLNQKVLTSNYMPLPVAGNSAILFGDFSYYWLADREGRAIHRLNELYAATDQVGFKITQRVDGRLIMPEAVKFLKMKTA